MAILQAEFDSYTSYQLPSSEWSYGEATESIDPHREYLIWDVVKGLTWSVSATTRMDLEYPQPINPDKYLRNKKLTLTHLGSEFVGTNITYEST